MLFQALYPNLITSNPTPENSPTIYHVALSQKTLWIMTIFATVGVPFVLAYTAVVYWTFRGKVRLKQTSY